MSAPARWLIGIAATVVVVIAVSVAVAIGTGGSETEFAAGTPEATVQAYFRAIRDRDADAAVAQFTDDLQRRCSAEDLRRSYQYQSDIGVRIRSTTAHDANTVVDVRIVVRRGDSPFDDSYQQDDQIVLERANGEWRIAEPPWPLAYCMPPPPTPAAQGEGAS
jgi:hypothetical protein